MRKNIPVSDLQAFFGSVAGQFQAGMTLAANDAEKNVVGRDIDSFIAEADRWFPNEFVREDFIKIAYL